MTVNITIDENRKCSECGKGGAVDSGICLKCTLKVLSARPLKSDAAKAIRARLQTAQRGFNPVANLAEVTRKS